MGKNNSDDKRKSYSARRKRRLAATAMVIAVIFIVWTVAASLMSVWADSTAEEMKGVWVSTAYNIDYPSERTSDPEKLREEADRILDNVKSMHMNTVFLQVRPFSDALYKSGYYPWSAQITGTMGKAPDKGFDPLAYWTEAAHKRGLELHAWINPYRMPRGENGFQQLCEAMPSMSRYADCAVQYSDGNWYFDPGDPAAVDLIVNGALEIVKNYDVDGIHMDDYFYPGPSFADDASWEKYGSGFSSREEWRRSNVNTLIARLDREIHAADSKVRFGISPQGIWANKSSMPNGSDTSGSEAYVSKYADCLYWIDNGIIDYIAPQIYWNIGFSAADYSILADWWDRAVDGSDVDLYIGIADYKATEAVSDTSVWYGSTEVARQLALNDTKKNIKGEIHFSYSSIMKNEALRSLYENFYLNEDDEPENADEDQEMENTQTTVPGLIPETPEAGQPVTGTETEPPQAADDDPQVPENAGSTDSGIGITVNGIFVEYTDAYPFIDGSSRTLCPLRAVGDALGMQVDWDPDKRQAVFTGPSARVVFTIGSQVYEVNGVQRTMDTRAIISGNRTFAPVRYLAEAAGYNVGWDDACRRVTINK